MEQQTNDKASNQVPRPYWIPPGVDIETLPEEVRAAILGVINPAYREFVLEARPGLQQTAGITLVSLLWLEMLDQIRFGREVADPQSLMTPSEERSQMIAQHLRLIGSKIKAQDFLLRLAEFREKYIRPLTRRPR